MAVSRPLAENGAVECQRSVRNRQCSLYASRVRSDAASSPPPGRSSPAGNVPQVPQLPPLSISPRWASLSNGPHLIARSPTSTASSPRHAWPDVLSHPAEIASVGGADIQGDPRSGPLTAKSSVAEMRSPDGVAVKNFSRPRCQSIRQPPPTTVPEQSAPEPAMPRLATVPHSDPLHEIASAALPPGQTPPPPWPRPSRRPSASSCQSSSALPSPLGPWTAGDSAPDPRPSRARNATAPTLTAVRVPFASTRADNTASASAPMPAPVPMAGGGASGAGGAPPPWIADDELRSSFRSQLTASTAYGTAVTERSSVLTKDSSVTSLYAHADEPSLEDVMGMYEKGFADDDDDDEDLENQTANAIHATAQHRDPGFGPRPLTAPGEQGGDLADTDTEPPLPTARSTLDAEIRQSRMIFTSPAFTSSVPALSGNADLDLTEKRDSGKSLNSEPSVASGPTAVSRAKMAIRPPRSPSPPSTASSACLSPCVSPFLPPAPPVATEPEDPGSRDRYGFKRQNQFITREQYDGWNKGYTQYLGRRRKKWVAYLKDCGLMTDRPIRFPPPNAKTKRFVRKGIPPDWRGAAWFYYAGGPAILAKHSGLYERLVHKAAKQIDAEAIERDLHRTFPDNIQFQPSAGFTPASSSQPTRRASTSGESSRQGPIGPEDEPPIITSLRRVLHAFSVYNPRIGYCQSLNFLAGLLLLFVETEEQCFWLLNVITIIYLPGTHDMSLEGSKVDLGVLMTELRDTMPGVWDRIGGELEGNTGFRPSTSKSVRKPRPTLWRRDSPQLSTERLPPITLCMTAWFMSCYIGTLPIETTLRVWDVFFYEGSRTLFRIALAIFKSGEAEIKAVSDPMEMFGVVQSLPRRMLDANALMETCFKRRNGFGHLSQDTIDERRQERRNRAQQDRAQQPPHGKAATSGDVTEVESEPVRRRGTLFRKKRREPSRPRAAEA